MHSWVRKLDKEWNFWQVRKAGAKKVYLASASPPVRFPNVYGVDMPTR